MRSCFTVSGPKDGLQSQWIVATRLDPTYIWPSFVFSQRQTLLASLTPRKPPLYRIPSFPKTPIRRRKTENRAQPSSLPRDPQPGRSPRFNCNHLRSACSMQLPSLHRRSSLLLHLRRQYRVLPSIWVRLPVKGLTKPFQSQAPMQVQ